MEKKLSPYKSFMYYTKPITLKLMDQVPKNAIFKSSLTDNEQSTEKIIRNQVSFYHFYFLLFLQEKSIRYSISGF